MAANNLAAARAEASGLASSLSQAETVNEALNAQLRELHNHHRKVCDKLAALCICPEVYGSEVRSTVLLARLLLMLSSVLPSDLRFAFSAQAEEQ